MVTIIAIVNWKLKISFLVAFVVLLLPHDGSSTTSTAASCLANYATCCPNRTTSTPDIYTCGNTSAQISCHKFNDGRNDCGDNTEEGTLNQYCTLNPADNKPRFKCRDFNCLYTFNLYNGIADCTDGSDEKLYIGDNCTSPPLGIDKVTKLNCDYFITYAECNSSYYCSCTSGSYSNSTGSTCIKRVYNDICSVYWWDCYDSNPSIYCSSSTNKCICNSNGFYLNSTANSSYCTQIKIGDTCSSDSSCGSYMCNVYCNTSGSSGKCACSSLYKANSDNTNCTTRVLGDSCTYDAQCQQGGSWYAYTYCNSTSLTCKCATGSTLTKGVCVPNTINSNCTSSTSCQFISHSICNSTTNKCACDSNYGTFGLTAYHVDKYGYDCSLGLGDLSCDNNTDCTTLFGSNSECYYNLCNCKAGYYESSNKQSCTLFKLGDTGCCDDDCDTAITNGRCSSGTCVCPTNYVKSSDNVCTYSSPTTPTLAQGYPWAIIFLLIAIGALIAFVVLLIIAKPWKNLNVKLIFNLKRNGTSRKSVSPSTTGYGIQNGKPIWTLRPKSGNPVMYDHNRMQAPQDPDVEAFLKDSSFRKPPSTASSGGSMAPPKTSASNASDVQAMFRASAMTPQVIDFDLQSETAEHPPLHMMLSSMKRMHDETGTDIDTGDVETARTATDEGLTDRAHTEGGETERTTEGMEEVPTEKAERKKGKKGKKGRAKKGKAKKGKGKKGKGDKVTPEEKENQNNNSNSESPEPEHQSLDDLLGAADSARTKLSYEELHQRLVRAPSAKDIMATLEENEHVKEELARVHDLNRERTLMSVEEKLEARKRRKRSPNGIEYQEMK